MNLIATLAGVMIAAVLATAAGAREQPYGEVTDAGLQRCDQLQFSGQGVLASGCYRSLFSRREPAVRAEAAWALGDFRSANDWFRDALKASPDSAAIRVRWGELYTDTHQNSEAFKLFSEALKLEPQNAWARLGAGEVLVGQYSKEATTYLDGLMEDGPAPPGARLRAQLLGAQVALENGELDEAAKLLQQAEIIATGAALWPLELQSLQAAQEQLHGRDSSALVAAVLKANPVYGEVYATLGHFYEIRRFYTEATAMFRKALQLKPELWSARVDLASGLMRDNRFAEARAEFEAAFKGDPYNPVTANSLRLLDTVAKFETRVFPDVATAGANSSAELVLRMNRKESALLAPYFAELALQAIKLYAERYDYVLKAPVVVEVYNNHEDFAVRTAGMPGLGLLGVTFGQVLAMDSPASRKENDFHWGTTLWHELAHVYTLESTHHRVPRWLSEGISVYEEWRTGPAKGISIPFYVYSALGTGKALPIAELDKGFIRPSYEQQLQVSYMQAGLVCEFIDQRWGHDKLVRLLAEYTRGADTPAAIKAAIGVDAAEFDRLFTEQLKRDYGKVFDNLKQLTELRIQAAKRATEANWDEAADSARQALAILPLDVESGSAYLPLAKAQLAQKKTAEAVATLTTYWQRGGHEPDALERLADELYTLGKKSDAAAVMQSINYVAPYDYARHGTFGDWLLELNRPTEALREYRAALGLNPPDMATAHYRMARAYHALKSDREARSAVLQSLEIAPSFRPAQQLLLELARSQPQS